MDAFTKQWFDSFRKIILDHSGILIQIDAMTDLGKKISERMRLLELDRFGDYHELVTSAYDNGSELRRLTELITNNETYFFREPAHFRVLKSHILPRMIREEPGKKIRVWSAGCSTGEEAYSLAITLLETAMLIGPFSAEVIGTDIDRAAIETAVAGVYGRNAFRAIEPYYLNTYFQSVENNGAEFRRIHDRVRSLVRFECLNLFQKPYPGWLSHIDVVFFRNVSIYFSKEKIEQINKTISETLREGGCLFLGSSETLHHNLGNLRLAEVDNVYLYQKIPGQPDDEGSSVEMESIRTQMDEVKNNARQINESAEAAIKKKSPRAPKTEAPHDPTDEDIFSAFKAGNYALALAWIAAQQSASLECLIMQAHIYIGLEKFDESSRICQKLMNREPLNPEVYFLYGLNYMYQKEYDLAVDYLKQSIFLKMELSLPHFHLASIYWLQNKSAEAKREYRNTVKILEQHKDTSISFALLGYSSDYLINACRQYLNQ